MILGLNLLQLRLESCILTKYLGHTVEKFLLAHKHWTTIKPWSSTMKKRKCYVKNPKPNKYTKIKTKKDEENANILATLPS